MNTFNGYHFKFKQKSIDQYVKETVQIELIHLCSITDNKI